MQKEVCTTLISLLCCMALLISCSNEEEIPLPKPSKENTWYWGYFTGEVNGNKISLENEDYNGPIKTGRRGAFDVTQWPVMPDSINSMGTLVNYNDSSELRVTLYDLTPSERYLTLFIDEHYEDDWINVTVYTNSSKKEKKALYIPSKENPFRVEITDVIWASRREPIIEVKLDGVLYNRENPKDAMVIKGVYGTR
ncbi:MAG: DUF5025 domain-containing protein [Lachnospiraceae bacterium]